MLWKSRCSQALCSLWYASAAVFEYQILFFNMDLDKEVEIGKEPVTPRMEEGAREAKRRRKEDLQTESASKTDAPLSRKCRAVDFGQATQPESIILQGAPRTQQKMVAGKQQTKASKPPKPQTTESEQQQGTAAKDGVTCLDADVEELSDGDLDRLMHFVPSSILQWSRYVITLVRKNVRRYRTMMNAGCFL